LSEVAAASRSAFLPSAVSAELNSSMIRVSVVLAGSTDASVVAPLSSTSEAVRSSSSSWVLFLRSPAISRIDETSSGSSCTERSLVDSLRSKASHRRHARRETELGSSSWVAIVS